MNWTLRTASFTQLGLSLSSNLTWKTHIHSLAKHASQKLSFLARARGFFSSSHLLSIYKSQIRPSLEYCSHVWGGAPKSTLCLLDKVQSKAIRLINNPNLTKLLQPFSHCQLVGDLSISSRYFQGHCSQEIRDIIPVPLGRVRTTRNSTHSHPFKISLPTSQTLPHKSSFIPTACSLWNVLPSPCFLESYNLPSFKSKINKFDLISLIAFFSSSVGALYRPPYPFLNPRGPFTTGWKNGGHPHMIMCVTPNTGHSEQWALTQTQCQLPLKSIGTSLNSVYIKNESLERLVLMTYNSASMEYSRKNGP